MKLHVDYYQILGVKEDADDNEIKKAYRKIASNSHPDKNPGDKRAEVIFKEATEAYSILIDSSKRESYDFSRRKSRDYSSYVRNNDYRADFTRMTEEYIRNAARRANADRDFTGFSGEDPFNRSFEDEDIEMDLSIDLEEAINGARKEIEFNYKIKTDCHECNPELLYGCKQFCSRCNGKKYIESKHKKKIGITVPIGVDTGQKLRFAGVVPPSPKNTPKDLYVQIRVREHETYKRKGVDLYRELVVPFNVAMNNQIVSIKNIDGSDVQFRVPEEILSGKAEVMIHNAGIKKIRGSGRGNLFISLNVSLPQVKTARAKKLLEEFLNEVYPIQL